MKELELLSLMTRKVKKIFYMSIKHVMGGNEDEEIRFLSGVNWKDKMQQAEMKTH